MVNDGGQSILAWLIDNVDNISLDIINLFIGHVSWDKHAVYAAAQKKQRYDIVDKLNRFVKSNRFQNNCNDMIITWIFKNHEKIEILDLPT